MQPCGGERRRHIGACTENTPEENLEHLHEEVLFTGGRLPREVDECGHDHNQSYGAQNHEDDVPRLVGTPRTGVGTGASIALGTCVAQATAWEVAWRTPHLRLAGTQHA